MQKGARCYGYFMVGTHFKYIINTERNLPWVLVLLHLLTGQSIFVILSGILIGHAIYFLKDELPPRGYPDVLFTPWILYTS